MVAKNDVTGDSIQTKNTSETYRNNYDRIFRKDSLPEPTPEEEEAWKELEKKYGGVAQLGERQLCKLDVAGSIPVTSTKYKKEIS